MSCMACISRTLCLWISSQSRPWAVASTAKDEIPVSIARADACTSLRGSTHPYAGGTQWAWVISCRTESKSWIGISPRRYAS